MNLAAATVVADVLECAIASAKAEIAAKDKKDGKNPPPDLTVWKERLVRLEQALAREKAKTGA